MASLALRELPASPGGEIRRTARRSPAALPVLVHFLGRTERASLRNLSQGGAMIETDARLFGGDEVDFRCGAIEVRAKVVWHAGRNFGLQFRAPVPEKDIRAQLLRADYLADRRSGRPGAVSLD